MPEKRFRIFARSFKLAAVLRMAAGENVSALARELGVRRKLLYEWRDAYRAGGEEALRGRGRPRKGDVVASGRRSGSSGAQSGPGPEAALSVARRRIAELERKVGQQTLEADFFRQALQRVETLRQPGDRRGGTASMASSRRGRGGKAD